MKALQSKSVTLTPTQRSVLGAAVSALTALTCTVAAHAQPSADSLGAHALFERGKELLKEGDWVHGCEKFQKSLDLALAVSTMVKIAGCREHEGRLATAWLSYQQALRLNRETLEAARRRELEAFIRTRADRLKPRLPRLRIILPESPPGIEVRRNGTTIPLSVMNEPLPVDPGAHEIVANAPGYEPTVANVLAIEGKMEEAKIELVKLRTEAPTDSVVPIPAPVAVPPTALLEPKPNSGASAHVIVRPVAMQSRSDRRGTVLRWHGWGLGGAGLASLGVAGYFGLRTRSLVRDMDSHCKTDVCDPEAYSLHEEAIRAQCAGYFLLGIGTVLVTGGVILYAVAPAASAAERDGSFAVAVGPGSIAARGAF